MIAFIQLRIPVTQYHKNRPVYEKVDKLTKDELIDKCLCYKHLPLQPRLYTSPTITIEPTNQTP